MHIFIPEGINYMFSVKKVPRKFLFLIIVAVIAVILLTFAESMAQGSAESKAVIGADASLKSDEYVSFLARYGWEIKDEKADELEIKLPENPDKVISRYNELQLSQGFDLTPYFGKTVKRISYKITNYPDTDEDVYANLIIYDGKIIGGDICTRRLGGFMHGFKLTDSTTGITGEQAGALAQVFGNQPL